MEMLKRKMALPGIKPQLLGYPDHSLITKPTTLSQLLM
jgi:hypothetical protein